MFSRATASRHFAMPKVHCSKLCNAAWQASSSPEEESFCVKKMCGFCVEWGASFGSMRMKKFCGNALHVTVHVLCSILRSLWLDVQSFWRKVYGFIRRRGIL